MEGLVCYAEQRHIQVAHSRKFFLTCSLEYGMEGTRPQERDKIKGYCVNLGEGQIVEFFMRRINSIVECGGDGKEGIKDDTQVSELGS